MPPSFLAVSHVAQTGHADLDILAVELQKRGTHTALASRSRTSFRLQGMFLAVVAVKREIGSCSSAWIIFAVEF